MKKLLLLLLLFISVISFGQVPSYVPTDSLVGYWGFNGNANDESGNGNDGTVNGATLTTDRFGNTNSAYDFDGVNDYISVNDANNLDGVGEFTISVWVNADIIPGSGGADILPVVSKWGFTGNDPNSSFILYLGSSEIVYAIDCSLNNANYGLYNATYTNNITNNWYHLVASNNMFGLKLYLNGMVVDSTIIGNEGIADNNTALLFGDWYNQINSSYSTLDGKLDDIGIWNRALDSVEVQQLYTGIMAQDTCFYTDTTFVTIYDTTYVTAYDTITYYDTVLVSVTDTLIIDVSLTGVTPPNNTNTILVYPNPSNDIVIIDNGDYLSMSGYTLKIINSLGQEVFNSIINIPQFQIPVSVLGSVGLYYIQVFDDNSSLLETKKLILN